MMDVTRKNSNFLDSIFGQNSDDDENYIYEEVDLTDPSDQDQEPLPPFPLDAFPDTFQLPVLEVMRHYKVDALLPAICALSINSAALGRGIVTKSNIRRTYPNLYSIIGALSGTGKSVVFDEFMAPLNEIQKQMLQEFLNEQKPRTEAELKLLEQEISLLTKQKKDSRHHNISEDNRHERLCELFQEKAILEAKLSFAARLYCVDFTSEALGKLLAENNEQVAVLTDEGGLALYNMLGRYTKGDITDDILLCKAKTVNGTTVDRISREPILLHHPCVVLLLLVQPDLLYKAFGNERLLVGGLLARCLTADSKMEVQYEDESTLAEADPEIMKGWNQHISSLVETFRFAKDPYPIAVGDGVRKLSRTFHNQIVDEIHDTLSDITSFAIRWTERAWEIALNLHAGHYGIQCHRRVLDGTIFSDAMRISRFFADRQLEVLQRPRIRAMNEQCERLEEILAGNGEKPLTLRDLFRRHGIEQKEVIASVKSHPELFGMVARRSLHGGQKSVILFLQSNPPSGYIYKKAACGLNAT